MRRWGLTRATAAAFACAPSHRRCCSSDGTAAALSQAAADASAGNSDTTLRETALRLLSLQRYHARNDAAHDAAQRRAIEREAWALLQRVPPSALATADVDDTTDMLATWCYFSMHWDRGMDGPHEATTTSSGQEDEASTLSTLQVPRVERGSAEDIAYGARGNDNARGSGDMRLHESEAATPTRRATPLDEVIDI